MKICAPQNSTDTSCLWGNICVGVSILPMRPGVGGWGGGRRGGADRGGQRFLHVAVAGVCTSDSHRNGGEKNKS